MNNTDIIEINPDYCGPPGCGQGGYVAGVLAEAHTKRFQTETEPCEISLKAPTPLGKPLSITYTDRATHLLSGEKILVSAQNSHLALDIPACPTDEETKQASALYRGHDSDAVFTTCFVCGADRHDGKAMRLFAGPLKTAKTKGLHAAHWIPDASHAKVPDTSHAKQKINGSVVAPEFIWSSLDCPGYFAGCKKGKMALLAQITATIKGVLIVGEKATVISWPLFSQGKKSFVGTALFNENKDCIAYSKGLWIYVKKSPVVDFQTTDPAPTGMHK